MKRESTLIWKFMREKAVHIFLFLFCVFLFWLVFYLYHIDSSIALYPGFLSLIAWGIFGSLRFFIYRKKHLLREKLSRHIDVTLDNLPKPESLLEADYQILLKTLNKEKNQEIALSQKKFRENQEYITLWAHQIKTPITAMEVLLQNTNSEEVATLKEKLFEINEYVDITMQYTRMDSLNADLMLQEYSLLSMLRQAVKYYSKIFIMKKIALNLEEMDTLVITDEKWLVFVLKQILSNSLKYIPQESNGEISIYMEPNAMKTLVIQDTGIGISPEDIPRILERGFTGYNGRMDKKATGIGLYLSNEILCKLNHKIAITSQVGVGTKVAIDLSNLTKM